MSELREAAERLRRYAAKVPMIDVWPLIDTDYPPEDQRRDDRRILADAWLAEHPAGDQEPIDGTFLQSIGFTRPQSPASQERYSAGAWINGYDPILFDRPMLKRKTFDVFVYGRFVSHIKTRGDVRRLLTALGIEGKA